MFRKLLRGWSASLGRNSRSRKRVQKQIPIRLMLESLEDRLTLDGSVVAVPPTHPSGPDVWIYPGELGFAPK